MIDSLLDFSETAIDRENVESNVQRDVQSPADCLKLEFVPGGTPLTSALKNIGFDD